MGTAWEGKPHSAVSALWMASVAAALLVEATRRDTCERKERKNIVSEVITQKFVKRDQRGYIDSIELSTNRRRIYVFVGRGPALWANSHYQRLQSIEPGQITVNHTIEKRY